jgi:hypothetical protein
MGAADCNGDGHLDLLITALHANGGGNDSGEAYLVLGPLESMDLGTADLRMIGEYSYDQAGYHGQIGGDLTGDGLPDLLVGATGFGESATQAQGATYVVSGTATGSLDLSAATARAIGTSRYDRLGYTHAGAADLDGDGVAELVVGAPTWPENAGQGAVYIWEGPLAGEMDPEDAPGRLEGEEEGDQAGSAVIAADLDGDGASELVIGAPARDAVEDTEGQVYLWSGAVAGPTSLSGAASTLLGSAERQAIGSALSAGDLDADGLDDLMLGASSADLSATDAGAAWVWYSPVVAGSSSVAEASVTLLGAGSRDSAGAGVALAGDLSGDWIPDLVVGASLRDGGAADSGVIFVMQGRDL